MSSLNFTLLSAIEQQPTNNEYKLRHFVSKITVQDAILDVLFDWLGDTDVRVRERAAATIVKLTSSLHYPSDYTDQDALMVISEHQAAYLLGKRIVGQKAISTYTPCQPLSIIR